MSTNAIATGIFGRIPMQRTTKIPPQFRKRAHIGANPQFQAFVINKDVIQGHKSISSRAIDYQHDEDMGASIVAFVDKFELGSKGSKDLDFASASEVKNKWNAVMKSVVKNGFFTIRNHNEPQVVMMPAENFDSLVEAIVHERSRIVDRDAAFLRELNEKFEREFSELQDSAHHGQVENLLDAFGKFTKPTKLGPVR